MAYFENMIESFEGSDFQLDAAFAARDMLVHALDWQNKSLKDFMLSKEAVDDSDDRMYWAMSCEANERARGLLDAYKILTNREVVNSSYAIKDELADFEYSLNL